jgi:methylenetetrahydrofolate reductase (NADPH)
MCRRLQQGGIKGFHFYTLNLEKSVRLILEGLGFVGKTEGGVRELPWVPVRFSNDKLIKKSLGRNRQNETVRPIFWANRMRSYILRTEGWDDYPNGRWGDSRSPAYGEVSGFGHATGFGHTKEECLAEWGTPKTVSDVSHLFEKYIRGEGKSLPWSDSPLKPETSVIRNNLASLNSRGFLTINSQPAVDGATSSDVKFGWGPKGGWVYQKAYLEFFVSDGVVDELVDRMNAVDGGGLTYYAVKKDVRISPFPLPLISSCRGKRWGC